MWSHKYNFCATSTGRQFAKKGYWQIGFEGSLNDTPDFGLFYEPEFDLKKGQLAGL